MQDETFVGESRADDRDRFHRSISRAKRILAEKFGKTAGVEGDLDTEGEKLIGQWAQEDARQRTAVSSPDTRASAGRLHDAARERLNAHRAASTCSTTAWRSAPADSASTVTTQLVRSFVSRGLKPEQYVAVSRSLQTRHAAAWRDGPGTRATDEAVAASRQRERSVSLPARPKPIATVTIA